MFPYISFIHPLQPSPTKERHVPMTEKLVTRMQQKSKHRHIVKFGDDIRLYTTKDMTQVQRAKETDKAHTTLIR